MTISRFNLLLCWLLIAALLPFVMVAFLLAVLFGDLKVAINTAIALDQSGNAIIGGNPDETISSACGRIIAAGRWGHWRYWFGLLIVDRLFGRGHCVASIGV